MSYCAQCGTAVTATDKFCPKCGHQNEASPDPPPAPASSQVPTAGGPSPRRKLSGCAIAGIVAGSLFAILGIIVVIALVLAFSLSSPAVDAIDAHLAALKQGQIETAYQGTSLEFQQATSLEDYRRFVDSYPALKDVTETTFEEREVENNLATLKGRITDSRGGVTPFQAQLRKEGETWKVQAIDLPGASPSPQPSANPAPSSPPAAPSPPPAPGASSVGVILVGAGRNPDGTLVNPGQPLPVGTPTISADIALINHPLGERVRAWVEQGQNRTEPIEASVEGEGSGTIPFEFHIGDAAFPPGRYTLVVELGESRRFTQDFEIR